MDIVQKFLSDIEKSKKYDRANHNNSYSGQRVSLEVKNLFINNNRGMESLASSFADYWYDTYISNSIDINNEPTEEHSQKLAGMLCLLQTQVTDEDIQCLTKQDLKELCSLTNMEAEDIPIDTLNNLMMIFVSKQAL